MITRDQFEADRYREQTSLGWLVFALLFVIATAALAYGHRTIGWFFNGAAIFWSVGRLIYMESEVRYARRAHKAREAALNANDDTEDLYREEEP